MDFLILRPLPPRTGYHFFGGGGGWGCWGGGQKFLLNRLQAVGTHSAVNMVSGPVVPQLIPDLPDFSAAAGGGAKVARMGFEPPTS